jgi:hypothetical protein
MRIVYEILLLQLTRAFARRVKKNDIALYIDEANDFPAYRLGEILKSGRREGLSVTATSQRIAEIPQSLQRELLKAGTIISFRLSTDNASILAPEFHTRSISADQLCMLKKFHMYIKTLQEGNPVVYEEVSTEMERDTLEYKGHRDAGQLKAEFAKTYGQDIATVEKDIASRIA